MTPATEDILNEFNATEAPLLKLDSVRHNVHVCPLGTCEASRFDSNSNRSSDSIRFESDWPIRKFSNRIGRSCFCARRKLNQMTQTIHGT